MIYIMTLFILFNSCSAYFRRRSTTTSESIVDVCNYGIHHSCLLESMNPQIQFDVDLYHNVDEVEKWSKTIVDYGCCSLLYGSSKDIRDLTWNWQKICYENVSLLNFPFEEDLYAYYDIKEYCPNEVVPTDVSPYKNAGSVLEVNFRPNGISATCEVLPKSEKTGSMYIVYIENAGFDHLAAVYEDGEVISWTPEINNCDDNDGFQWIKGGKGYSQNLEELLETNIVEVIVFDEILIEQSKNAWKIFQEDISFDLVRHSCSSAVFTALSGGLTHCTFLGNTSLVFPEQLFNHLKELIDVISPGRIVHPIKFESIFS
jgi:hypothetical protein